MRYVISPSELASEPTSLVRGRLEDVLILISILFRHTEAAVLSGFFRMFNLLDYAGVLM